ncbi:hypothetical protein N8664_00975 [Verrucomicrobia bacterium]|nr:hypothetical protein [Verrucomicrobiota bacterium]
MSTIKSTTLFLIIAVMVLNMISPLKSQTRLVTIPSPESSIPHLKEGWQHLAREKQQERNLRGASSIDPNHPQERTTVNKSKQRNFHRNTNWRKPRR